MATKKFYVPPVLKNGENFECWLKEIKLWQCVTELPKEKQGPAIFLSLEDQARRCCEDLPVAELNAQDGVTKLITKLEELYKKDETQVAFMYFDEFETFQRPSTMNVTDYINEFCRLYDRAKEKGLTLSDGVLAIKVLKQANISYEKQTLCRATIPNLTFDAMKKQLKAIFTKVSSQSSNNTDNCIKVEPTYAAENEDENEVFFARRKPSYASGCRGNSYRENQRFNRNRRGNYRGGRFNVSNKDSSTVNVQDKNNYFPKRGGNSSRCYICDSTMHWASDCPHNEHTENKEALVQLLANDPDGVQTSTFMMETFNMAVLDSGCSKTVCGKMWLSNYIMSLSKEDVSTVVEKEGKSIFKFGDSRTFKALKQVTIPAKIGSVNVRITTDVVECEIPLLFSKSTMKAARTYMDFTNDRVMMLDQNLNLKFTTSGHYCIPLITGAGDIAQVLLSLGELSSKEKERAARKIHIQFGHADHEKILKIVQDAKCNDKELINCIKVAGANCDVCKRYKKVKSRPAVALSIANELNDVISMDLKVHGKVYFLHIIDQATRFSAGAVIKSKKKEVIIDNIFKHWVAIFGCPKKILTDNGGEFENELLRELGDLLNAEILTTAAEAPWQNGITERHNAIIGNTVTKVMEETHCSIETALAWALASKNSLSNVYGFSSNQLVFGHNPNYPSVLYNNPPALENMTSSELIAKHLNAMHSARKFFIENEAKLKLSTALKRKTRTSTALVYDTGDMVYYKRLDSKRWRGPAQVIGKTKNQVFVKHGGYISRVNPCHLQHTSGNNSRKVASETTHDHQPSNHHSNKLDGNHTFNDGNADRDNDFWLEMLKKTPVPIEEEPNVHVEEDNNYEDGHEADDVINVDDYIDAAHGDEVLAEPDVSESEHSENSTIYEDANETVFPQEMDTIHHQPITNVEARSPGRDNIGKILVPNIGSKILLKYGPDDPWLEGEVLSRAGKATGKNKYFYNIHDANNDKFKCIDFGKAQWKYIEEEVLISMGDTNSSKVLDAKMKELENLKTHCVYNEVRNNGDHAISTRWVVSKKISNGEEIIKARLVARGFEEYTGDMRKDSPTISRPNTRLLLVIASSNNWKLKTLDVKSAFLQGKETERKILIIPPKEASTDNLWSLNKTIYGLCDASREWYLSVREEFLKNGGTPSLFDAALFYWKNNDTLIGIVSSHVDDFMYSGTVEFEKNVIQKMKLKYQISKETISSFCYLGLDIIQNNNGIIMHQGNYINELEPLTIDNSKNKTEALTNEEFDSMQSMIGKLVWVCNQTRPDIAFDTCQLSTGLKDAKIEDLKRVNKTIKRLKCEKVSLIFPNIGNIRKSKLVFYSDASHKNLPNGGSQGGFVSFILGENGKHAPLDWSSKRIRRVVKSPLAAETLVLVEAAEHCFLMKKIIQELFGIQCDIIGVTDSKSLKDSCYSTTSMEDKRLMVEICLLREMLQRKEITEIQWVPKKRQIADSLTKFGASTVSLLDILSGSQIQL